MAAGLAQDGKVVSVRLALFAEMVKDKPWVPATLEEVGGTEGIGVNFLEETFSGRKANPEAPPPSASRARGPEGPAARSRHGHQGPHAVSCRAPGGLGLSGSPRRFQELASHPGWCLAVDHPTDPDGVRSGSGSDTSPKYYQLTHDYLVPSLREWLTRKQKETRQGRAELRLAELAALWNSKRENRRLPGWSDYRNIRRLTDGKKWTKPQRSMMQQAARYHAQAVVRRLLEADLVDVPGIVGQVHQLRKWTQPLLRREQQAAPDQSKVKLHTALAVWRLMRTNWTTCTNGSCRQRRREFPILRDALAEHREKLSGRLWSDADSAASEERRLRAAAALATYDSGNPPWRTIRDEVAQTIDTGEPEFLGDWKEVLRSVRAELLGPLAAIFRNHELGELQLALATSTLADYAADDVCLLADLVSDADPQQFAGLFPVLARHGEAAISELERDSRRWPSRTGPRCPPDPLGGTFRPGSSAPSRSPRGW